MASQRKITRATKAKSGTHAVPNQKSTQWGESFGINKINLTDTQKELVQKIQENTLTFVEGPAGSGKTLSILYTFIKEYMKDPSKQIIVIRTPVEAGMDKIGALPDDLKAKTEPHFQSTKILLESLLTKGKVETDMDHRIHFKIPNYCIGSTFDNSLLLIDEVQQLPPLILKLLLERTGINSKVVITGDSTQLYVDARNRNALRDCIPRFFTEDKEPKYDDIAYHKFEVEDIMRSDIVKTVVRAYAGVQMRRLNLEGHKYGKLTVLQYTKTVSSNGMSYYLCICDCGNKTEVSHGNLRSGHTESCGCLTRRTGKDNPNSTHCMVFTKEYKAWNKIKERCFNKNDKSYPDYGAKGVLLDEDLRLSFEKFYEEVGQAPSKEHSIDRIDNNKGYTRGNMRWATKAEQSRNRLKFKVNSSGETGVNFYFDNKPSHSTYAVAQWKDIDGKPQNKKFSVKKLGLMQAFKLAVIYRRERIEELNKQGAGYSAHHGKDRNEH